jgi:hypothetical protein
VFLFYIAIYSSDDLSGVRRLMPDKYSPLRMFDSSIQDTEPASQCTLRPILEDNQNCLTCQDVPGLESIALTELEVLYGTRPAVTETYRSSDVFAGLAQLQRPVSPWAELLRASFTVKFRDARGSCRIVIEPPDVSVLDGQSDTEIVNRWLTRRGFVSHEEGTPHAVTDAVLGAH